MQSNPDLVIDLAGVTLARDDTVILDRIDWRVARGENWVLLGANGSGKTSLLSALSAYQPPTRGTIRVLGNEYGRADWRELRKKMGIVSSSLLPMMAGQEEPLTTVMSGKFAMLGWWGERSRADEERALGILEQIECTHLRGRPWRVLSQGERQRVLIGRALMAEPELVILDEPCAGLDPAAREHFLRFLDRIAGQRTAPSLVLVTHHVEEIVDAFTHALVLARGRVVAAGRKEEVVTSAILSEAFGTGVAVRANHGRYELQVEPKTAYVV